MFMYTDIHPLKAPLKTTALPFSSRPRPDVHVHRQLVRRVSVRRVSPRGLESRFAYLFDSPSGGHRSNADADRTVATGGNV